MAIQLTDIRAARLGIYILNTYTPDQVKELLDTMEVKNEIKWDTKPPIQFILDVVLGETEVTLEQFQSKRRLKEYVYARQTYCYLAAKIYDPDNLNGACRFKYGSHMKDGLRASISEHLTRDASMVSINIRKVYNYVKLLTSVREEMAYLEELIYAKFHVSKDFREIIKKPLNE